MRNVSVKYTYNVGPVMQAMDRGMRCGGMDECLVL